LEGGRIRQTGTHEQLIREEGLYQGLFQKQAFFDAGSLL